MGAAEPSSPLLGVGFDSVSPCWSCAVGVGGLWLVCLATLGVLPSLTSGLAVSVSRSLMLVL